MTIYVIGYDLHKNESYDSLIEAIKKLGSWWHCLDSTWLVSSTGTAVEIRNELMNHIYSDDQLLVVKYGGEAAWYGFTGGCQDWLNNNL